MKTVLASKRKGETQSIAGMSGMSPQIHYGIFITIITESLLARRVAMPARSPVKVAIPSGLFSFCILIVSRTET